MSGEKITEDTPPAIIYEDNMAAIHIARNAGLITSGTRHMAVKYYFVRQAMDEGLVDVSHMSGTTIPSDLLTKILPRPRQQELLPSFFGRTHHEMMGIRTSKARRNTTKL
jgi:hypothetical protein